ncbi:DEAD/DEAH box helicase family protein [Oceanobacillus profundus]|uniref:DEAD/DEAH box helicase family protein n=1 Tax=Oceanobacillus profundus TaxID=372463 RepID=UPI00203CD8E9|nr:DEAD/DEAH box helicase family protein [Oceanobacillus profundus]MCM3398212.1 DEAD/DEAH box helicase family protein [Oceanobacillus profundus]
MDFKSLRLLREYRTGNNDVISDFFVPVLEKSREYNRAVGYFTTDALINLSEGIIGLIKNKGKIKVIASPHLLESDMQSFVMGSKINDKIVTARLVAQLHMVEDMNSKMKLDLIANLIAAEILEIKIAYKPNGIYHEKIGVMKDTEGNYIAIDGSNNETFSAQVRNYESFKVFVSWIPGISDYAKDTLTHFENLWSRSVKGLKVYELPEAVEKKIINSYKSSSDLESAIKKIEDFYENRKQDKAYDSIDSIDNRKLHDYQQKAIEEFIYYDYCHFFEMATGTGKTFTSVRGLKKLERNIKQTYIIILVPQTDLQYQWYDELNKQGVKNIYTIGGTISSNDWKLDFRKSMIEYNLNKNSIYYIATYDSFFSKLNLEINNIRNLTIVIDEAHNLSSNQITKLPRNAKFRLGLSATPEKHSKSESEAIVNYFIGDKRDTYRYTIEEAIASGALSKYMYHPIFIELTEDEFTQYNHYTQSIAAARTQEIVDTDRVNRLLNERSLIVKKCENKLIKLGEMLDSPSYNFKNSVIYCGQGKLGDSDEKIIDLVTSMLYDRSKYRVSTFTSATENRRRVLEEFESGYYDTLVAIKCFDEGVDVPKLDKIFIMASDRLLRQTVQRRGRVLRICIESGKEIAYIYDFVAIPPSREPNSGRNLVRNEFYRVREYARLAENRVKLFNKINHVESLYGIKEEDYNEQDKREEYSR